MANVVATKVDQRTNAQMQDLRRDILNATANSEQKARSAQDSLDVQGVKLKSSVRDAQVILKQADNTEKAVDDLISQAKASKTKRVLQCCCWCCYQTKEELRYRNDLSTVSADSTDLDDINNEGETLVKLEKLRRYQQPSKANEVDGTPIWKRTLRPSLTLLNSNENIWYQQMDASLSQLQQVADEMNQSLDEQIKLAQMLTIYLNHGVDQVIGTREKLVADKALF